jgi:hypothetical protein
MVTVETAEQLVLSSRPRGGLLRGPLFVLLGISILVGGLSADSRVSEGTMTWLLPQLLVLAIGGVLVYYVRRQRLLARRIQEGVEAVQLRQWPRAWQALSTLLRRPVPHPAARAESLLALAALAESDNSFEASQRIYERLLEERQADPVQLHTARLGLGAAMLRTGQTADAVGLIDRLEREDLPGSLKARTELLALFREITMGHAADRLDRADERRDLFRRHLGTRAGYGYALLAYACDQAGDSTRAARFWHDATLLLGSFELIRRFGQLERLSARYPAACVPPGLMPGASCPAEITG